MKEIHLVISVLLDGDDQVIGAHVEEDMCFSSSHFPYGNTWLPDEERWENRRGFDPSLNAAIDAVNTLLKSVAKC